jgi:carboxylesterase type B
VQQNIAGFGGNKNKVTLHGQVPRIVCLPVILTIDPQSAGAMSAAVHLTSPSSWSFFHGVFLQSSPWGVRCLTAEGQ